MPADLVFTRFERGAYRSHDFVCYVCMRVNRKAAEVERRHVVRQLRIARFRNQRAPKADLFELCQHRFLHRQHAHSRLRGGIDPAAHRLIDNHIDVAILHGVETVAFHRQTFVVAHLSAPGNDIVERKIHSRQNLFDNRMKRLIFLPAHGHA